MKRRRGFRLAVILIACMGLLALTRLVVKVGFMENERFHLQDFSVVTEGPLEPDDIISATGIHYGENLLMISLTAVRDRLESLPEVRKARVVRDYPGVLKLEVTQRKPVAWLQSSALSSKRGVANAGCMLDADGVVLPDFKRGVGSANLPCISVSTLSTLVPGRVIDSAQVIAALHLLVAQMGADLEFGKIDASRKYGLLATTAHGGVTVTFGFSDFDKQFMRLGRVMADAEQRHRALATVNLLVEHNVPVTFRDISTATATTIGNGAAQPHRALASVK